MGELVERGSGGGVGELPRERQSPDQVSPPLAAAGLGERLVFRARGVGAAPALVDSWISHGILDPPGRALQPELDARRGQS